jgi:hypothetical protein
VDAPVHDAQKQLENDDPGALRAGAAIENYHSPWQDDPPC